VCKNSAQFALDRQQIGTYNQVLISKAIPMSTEAQPKGTGRVEVTEEVKKLAGRCVAEGIAAAEIQDVSDETKAQLSAYLRSLGGKAEEPEATGGAAADPVDRKEASETADPRLTRFVEQYNASGFSAESRTRCRWEEVQARLLANNGHYLALAEAMNGGGVLFGVDAEGNPLIADVDGDPMNLPHCGLNYGDTRKAVYLKDTRGEWKPDNMSGYEMFPYAGNYDKSPEILAFEQYTGQPFVVSPNKDQWRSSWLESGLSPAWPRFVDFDPFGGHARVDADYPEDSDPRRGVRRLLRVKKS
jgi:hypothetical protein